MSGRQPTPGAAGVGGTSCWRVQPMSCIGSALTTATWRSGSATVCKTVYPGSIPGVASNSDPTIQKAQGWHCPVGGAGACARACQSHTQEVAEDLLQRPCMELLLLCDKCRSNLYN